MQQNDDPRNIFYNQRQQYNEETQGGAKRGNGETSGEQRQGGTKSQQQNSYDEKLAEMKRLAAKYEREGEGQLVKDIVNNVLEQKAAGNLTNEQLLAFAKRVTPLLNAEQRERLNALVDQLVKL